MRLFFKKTKVLPNDLSDDELVLLYQNNYDLEVVSSLFKRYQHLIIASALRYSDNAENAEDSAMEIFEVLAADLKSTQVSNFSAWLYSVTKNHCLKKIRKEKREQNIIEHQAIFMENTIEMDHCNEVLNDSNIEALKAAINELKEDQRKCIVLFYLEKKSYKEIAIETEYSEKSIKSYIQNGKRKLKIILTKDDEK